MHKNIVAFDELAFESAAELKWLLSCRCEVEFIQKGKAYSITHFDGHHCISEDHYLKDGKVYNLLSNTEYDISNMLESDDLDEIMNFRSMVISFAILRQKQVLLTEPYKITAVMVLTMGDKK